MLRRIYKCVAPWLVSQDTSTHRFLVTLLIFSVIVLTSLVGTFYGQLARQRLVVPILVSLEFQRVDTNGGDDVVVERSSIRSSLKYPLNMTRDGAWRLDQLSKDLRIIHGGNLVAVEVSSVDGDFITRIGETEIRHATQGRPNGSNITVLTPAHVQTHTSVLPIICDTINWIGDFQALKITIQSYNIAGWVSLMTAPLLIVRVLRGRRRLTPDVTGTRTRHREKAFVLSVIGIIGLVNLAPGLGASWGIVDDHEIAYYKGTDDNLLISEIPETLLDKTEIGRFGASTRFRPSYYSLRLIETALYGGRPGVWYAVRIGIWVMVAFAVYRIGAIFVGKAIALPFALYVVGQPYWLDIVNRLGPAEAYVAFGLALIGLSVSRSDPDQDETGSVWPEFSAVALFAGSVVAMGSKETNVYLLVPAAIILVKEVASKRLDLSSVLASIGVILFGAVVVLAVYQGVSPQQTDVYGRSTAILDRLRALVPGLLTRWNLSFWVIFLLAAGIGLVRSSQSLPTLTAMSRRPRVAFALLFNVFYLSQFVFYQAPLPPMRYAFPGLAFAQFSVLLISVELIEWLKVELRGRKLYRLLKPTLGVLLIAGFTVATGQGVLREGSVANRETTNRFWDIFTRATERLQINPDAVLVLESHSVWDYEPIRSVQRYLSAAGVTNDVSLRVIGYPGESESEFMAGLGTATVRLSNRLYSFSEIGNRECFVLTMSKDGAISENCRSLGRVY